MKIAFITDIHFGCRNNDEIFLQSQLKFFTEQFFPELKEKNIDTICILGDFFDNRNSINVKILNVAYDLFKNYFKDFNVHMLVGNHDSYLKTTIEINSLKFFKEFSNVTVYENITEVTLGNRKIVMIPWIVNEENFEKELENYTKNDYCFGHFDMIGFNMNEKSISTVGLNSDIFFKKFKLILSGHYHTPSKKSFENSDFIYLGSPFQITRADIDSKRGYYILDTNTNKLDFYENNKSIKFIKIKYPDMINSDDIKGNFVDIDVTCDKNFNEIDFNKYINEIENMNPSKKVEINYTNVLASIDPNIEIKDQSVLEMVEEVISDMEIEYNKNEIIEKIKELYHLCNSNDI